MSVEGECYCGTVRYRVEGALGHASACHCSRCRKLFSGASSAYAEVPDGSKFSWVSGEDQLGTYTNGSWGVAFCRVCGSTLCGIHANKVHGITLGTVNGDPGVELQMHLYVGSKAPWDHIGGSAPQFEESAPSPTLESSPIRNDETS